MAPVRRFPETVLRLTGPVRILLLTLLVLLAYLPVFEGGFVWDDVTLLRLPHIQQPSGILKIWFDPMNLPGEEHYWPMVYSAFYLLYQVFGYWAPAFHGFNVLVHLGNCLLLGLLLRRLGLQGVSLAVILFAIHPVHVESVAWIIELKDLLSGLFFLSAILVFVPFLERATFQRSVAILGLALLGLLSKSVVATLPGVLFVLTWWKMGRIPKTVWTLLGGLTLLTAMVLTFDFQIPKASDRSWIAPPLLERLQIAGSGFWFYFRQLVVPWPLSPLYPKFAADVSSPLHWLPLIVAGLPGLLLGLNYWRKPDTSRSYLAVYLLYLGVLSPTLGIIPFSFMSYSYVADRYQYLASAAPIVAAAHWIGIWYHRFPNHRPWQVLVVVVPILAYLPLTHLHSITYCNNLAFARSIKSLQPDHPLALQMEVVAYSSQRNLKPALESAERLAQVQPQDPISWNNLGVLQAQNQLTSEALVSARRALQLDPNHQGARRLLQALEGSSGTQETTTTP